MVEKVIEMGMLFDFYGKLLSDIQYNSIDLYYIHDLSLSEIAENLKISRQGVHDAIKRAENNLYSFEEKLGLVKKFEDNKGKVRNILKFIDEINENAKKLNSYTIDKNIENIRVMVLDILESQEG